MKKIKLTKNQHYLLVEALRRSLRFHPGESLTVAWTGLGSATQYKSVSRCFMKIATSPNPGYSTWWKLTELGAKIVQSWIDLDYTYVKIENNQLPPLYYLEA